jgi:hypothetical protein
VNRIRTKPSAEVSTVRRARRPKLTLVRGGCAGEHDGSGRAAEDDRAGTVPAHALVRERLVRRAQVRVASGFYERPAVREQLVQCLWEELFSV